MSVGTPLPHQGTVDNVQRHFQSSHKGVLLASSGWRPGVLLNTLPGLGQLPHRKSDLVKMSTVPRPRNPSKKPLRGAKGTGNKLALTDRGLASDPLHLRNSLVGFSAQVPDRGKRESSLVQDDVTKSLGYRLTMAPKVGGGREPSQGT